LRIVAELNLETDQEILSSAALTNSPSKKLSARNFCQVAVG